MTQATPLDAPGWQLVPKEPDEAILRPFYGCPPEELPLAWQAALYIAAKRAPGAAAVPPVQEPVANGGEHLYIRLTLPEGYEDVHPDLVVEDAGINPAFRPEPASPTAAESAAVAELVELLSLVHDDLAIGAHPHLYKEDISALLAKYKAAPTADQAVQGKETR